MLKKNQLALILLTLVMMLTVYYIRAPFDRGDDLDDDDLVDVVGRLPQLTEKRMILRNSRRDVILELDAIIASNDATVEEKNYALEQKQKLNELTEKELMVELDIINKGYRDAFVHATSNGVDVTVVADEHTLTEANKIILQCLVEFAGISNDVRVQFQTVAEVSGTVD